ncbi:MAG: (2Fe-2S)-binding protein [Candidatus Riflebacteria bacterium]|nr:(2Fe-2S)-binding protein [Candidatus Riflebacteria bacterium]
MKDDSMICYCMKVTESTIVESIKNGAKTIKDIRAMTLLPVGVAAQ